MTTPAGVRGLRSAILLAVLTAVAAVAVVSAVASWPLGARGRMVLDDVSAPAPPGKPAPARAAPLAPGGVGSVTASAASPQDPYVADQWGLVRVQAPDAWPLPSATGLGVTVAVVDTGVDLQHEDLTCPGKLLVVPGSDIIQDGNDADDHHGHGTHVAGIVASCTNNGIGTAGVAPDATIMPVQVLDPSGSGSLSDAARGIALATASGAHVINLSLSAGPASAVPLLIDFLDPAASEIREAIDDAVSKGVVVVSTAGNNSMPLCEYPGSVEKVICVGAVDNRDLKAWYSGLAFKEGASEESPTLVAPGGTETAVLCGLPQENVLSLWPAELDPCDEGRIGYSDIAGTSMAAPHVSGVAAILYGRLGGVRNTTNAAIVRRALVQTADDLGAPGMDPIFGYGLVNALRATQAVEVVTVAPSGASAEAGSKATGGESTQTSSGTEGDSSRRTTTRPSASRRLPLPASSPTAAPRMGPVDDAPPEAFTLAADDPAVNGGWGALSWALAVMGVGLLGWGRLR